MTAAGTADQLSRGKPKEQVVYNISQSFPLIIVYGIAKTCAADY